jgi:hypothetical protein
MTDAAMDSVSASGPELTIPRHMTTVTNNGDGRGVSWCRAIVVEDHEQFRRFVCSTLRSGGGTG